MSPDTTQGSRWGHPMVQFLLTYVAARAFGWVAGIRYNPIADPFDALKVSVDVALWLLCWLAVGAVLVRIARRSQHVGA